jgi:hypothetical protein
VVSTSMGAGAASCEVDDASAADALAGWASILYKAGSRPRAVEDQCREAERTASITALGYRYEGYEYEGAASASHAIVALDVHTMLKGYERRLYGEI